MTPRGSVLALASLLALALGACGAPAAGDDGGDDDPAAPDAGGADAADPPADAATGARLRVAGTGGAGLNLRAGPGTEHAVLHVMAEGTIVTQVGGPEGGFLQVDDAGTTGWASAQFLAAIPEGGGFLLLLPWTAEVTFRVTQGHHGGSHTGNGAWAWDIGMPVGTPLLAAHDGVVRRVKGDSTLGACDSAYASHANYVVLDRGDGLETLYLHLDRVAVTAGQAIRRGELIGWSGQTGWSCGPHLHVQAQRSPSGGGGETWYNASVQEHFHDTGAPWDPPAGANVTSKNGVIDVPREAPGGGVVILLDPADAHAGGDWDAVMRAVAD